MLFDVAGVRYACVLRARELVSKPAAFITGNKKPSHCWLGLVG